MFFKERFQPACKVPNVAGHDGQSPSHLDSDSLQGGRDLLDPGAFPGARNSVNALLIVPVANPPRRRAPRLKSLKRILRGGGSRHSAHAGCSRAQKFRQCKPRTRYGESSPRGRAPASRLPTACRPGFPDPGAAPLAPADVTDQGPLDHLVDRALVCQFPARGRIRTAATPSPGIQPIQSAARFSSILFSQ